MRGTLVLPLGLLAGVLSASADVTSTAAFGNGALTHDEAPQHLVFGLPSLQAREFDGVAGPELRRSSPSMTSDWRTP